MSSIKTFFFNLEKIGSHFWKEHQLLSKTIAQYASFNSPGTLEMTKADLLLIFEFFET